MNKKQRLTSQHILLSTVLLNYFFARAFTESKKRTKDIGKIICAGAFTPNRGILPTTAYTFAITDKMSTAYYNNFGLNNPRWYPASSDKKHFGITSASHFGESTYRFNTTKKDKNCEFARIIEFDNQGIGKTLFFHSSIKEYVANDDIMKRFTVIAADVLSQKNATMDNVINETEYDGKIKRPNFNLEHCARLQTQDGYFTVHFGHVMFVENNVIHQRRFSFTQNKNKKMIDARISKNPQNPNGIPFSKSTKAPYGFKI